VNAAAPKQYSYDRSPTRPGASHADGIEWEELPSLASRLNPRLTTRGAWRHTTAQDSSFDGAPARANVWDATMPAELDAALPSQPLRETLTGLATREVLEPGVFDHFFGNQAA
jgi:hypothetical protein